MKPAQSPLSINITNLIQSAAASSSALKTIPSSTFTRQKGAHLTTVITIEMDRLSYTVFMMAYLCNSIVSDNIGVSNTPFINTQTTRDGLTSSPNFGERNEHTSGAIVTNSVSGSDTTHNASTFDNGCSGDNVTDLYVTKPSSQGLQHEVLLAVVVINRVQLAITSAGFFANAATYLTLTFNGGRFSPLILLLIKHQALLDMGACGMGSLYQFLPTGRWLTGSRAVDDLICHIWHNQMIFWICMTISIWNLVLIGIERFIMICKLKPFDYLSVTRRHFFYSFVALYVACVILLIPSYLKMDLVDGVCLTFRYSEGFWYRFYLAYGFNNIIVFYVLPVGAFVFL